MYDRKMMPPPPVNDIKNVLPICKIILSSLRDEKLIDNFD